MSWYPSGSTIHDVSYPGSPITAATLSIILNVLGIKLGSVSTLDPLLSDPVYVLAVIFPVLFGSLTCLVVYFLGKDLGGEASGLFAALFLSLDSAHIGRTSLGFFDDETVGIFSMLLFILLYLRSIDKKRSLKSGLLYSTISGLTLGYLIASWGASRYAIVMTALFSFVLILIGRYSRQLFISFLTTYVIAFIIAIGIPRVGPEFLFQIEVLPVYGVLFLFIIKEVYQHSRTLHKKMIYSSLILAIVLIVFGFLWYSGMLKGLPTKFLSLFDPSVRSDNPLVASVAEHRPSAWGTFYYNFGLGIFFLPVGLFFATMMATNLSIFMIIYGLTSIYFASSMIRLNIIMSPVVSLLFALALTRILKPFILFLKESPRTTKRKTRYKRILSKETSAGILIAIFLLLTFTYVVGTDFLAGPRSRGPRVYSQALTPTTISSAGMSITPSEINYAWINTLIWIRENLPLSPQKPGEPGTVIAAWWDYGYWITTIANRTSLADNGTWNSTQIKQLGLIFMSNETESVKLLDKYGVTHVIVFTTFDTQGRLAMVGGDEGKWQWMAKIPGLNDAEYGNYTLGVDWIDYNVNGQPDENDGFFNNRLGQNTTLFKLMNYGRLSVLQGFSDIQLEYFEKTYFSEKFPAQPVPGTNYIALVCVYKVNYPAEQ
jgi:dolichyl-diphosphooligosaccharide--protein glycosyltransferase